MRGGSGGAGGPGSPGEDRWSVSADPFGSRSAAAYRKSPLGPDHRSVFALRLCPTPTPTVSRPGASYPSRRSLNAELWVRSFQLLTHSSADDQDFAQNWMCWAPAIADEYYFVSSKHYFAQNKISNLTVIFSRFIAEAFSVSTETADRPPPRQRIEPPADMHRVQEQAAL